MRSTVAALLPLFAVLIGVSGFATSYSSTKTAESSVAIAGQPRVKLAVLVVFDQLRGDLVEKWRPQFGKDGFVRLETEGAWFTNCHYPYGVTTTGPGHASMLSGTCPDRHGIVNNDWFENHRNVYCAGSERYQLVPDKGSKSGGTPERMLCETLADSLKRETAGRGKVFGISLKDRSAILPAGKKPDGAYWFSGQFVTSTYYPNDPQPWVREFNKSKFADQWFGKSWDRLHPKLDYAALSGADDVRGEGTGASFSEKNKVVWRQGRTFPHPMSPPMSQTPNSAYYTALATSPYGNELLLEFTKRCIAEEKLGQDDVPDLLVVSFSSNDLVGHAWGPNSQEVMDTTLRSDAIMAQLLGYLDSTVGAGNYVLALTADHGVCPLPEVAMKDHPAGRVNSTKMLQDVEKALDERFGPVAAKARWVEKFQAPWFHLNDTTIAKSGRTREEVSQALAQYLATRPDVDRAFTSADLLTAPVSDPVATRMKRSYYPTRCGDVCPVLKPYFIFGSGESGTTHGSPWDYDTHVPLLVMGPGVAGGPKAEAVTPQAASAIFAMYLGVSPPRCAEYPVPATLEAK